VFGAIVVAGFGKSDPPDRPAWRVAAALAAPTALLFLFGWPAAGWAHYLPVGWLLGLVPGAVVYWLIGRRAGGAAAGAAGAMTGASGGVVVVALVLPLLVTLYRGFQSPVADDPSRAGGSVAKASADGRAALDRVAAAYAGLKSLHLVGTYQEDASPGRGNRPVYLSFAADYQSPATFRLQYGDMIDPGPGGGGAVRPHRNVTLLTGTKLYGYRREDGNTYQSWDIAPGKLTRENQKVLFPINILLDNLRDTNPAVLLAVAANGAGVLTERTPDVRKAVDAVIGAKTYGVLELSNGDGQVVQLFVDPTTNLIGRAVLMPGRNDIRPRRVVDYTEIAPDVTFPRDRFEWVEPPGSKADPSRIFPAEPR
jgi:hypothetical protein